MVSVVVLVYNGEKYISKCIKSLKEQTYSQLEIIIIDSDSSDKTRMICEEEARKDNRIHYVCKKNEGPGEARNMGYLLATCPYITFIDGDDWLELDAVENMVNSANDLDADIVVGDMLYVYASEDGKICDKKYSKIRFANEGIISGMGNENVSLINNCRTFTCGKLYRTEFLKEINFRQGEYIYEDVAIVPYLVAKAKTVTYINKPVYNYLKNRAESLTNNEKKYTDMLIALNELYIKFQAGNMLEQYSKELKRLIWGQMRFVCLKKINLNRREGLVLYGDMLSFYKEKFADSYVPDEYDIYVYNGEFMKEIMDNLLIIQEKVRYIEEAGNVEKK